jgi:hypothetical protein
MFGGCAWARVGPSNEISRKVVAMRAKWNLNFKRTEDRFMAHPFQERIEKLASAKRVKMR